MLRKIFTTLLKLRWLFVFGVFITTTGYFFYESAQFEKQHKATWDKLVSQGQVQSASTVRPSPTSTTIQQKTIIAKVETDPVVACNVHANCGGGTKQLKQSICSESICCQLKSGWVFYESKSKCTTDQNAQYNSGSGSSNTVYVPTWTPKPTQPPCTVYYPATNTYYTYTTFTPAECETERSRYATPVKTPTPTIDPALIQAHQDACNQVQAEWQAYKENFYPTNIACSVGLSSEITQTLTASG